MVEPNDSCIAAMQQYLPERQMYECEPNYSDLSIELKTVKEFEREATVLANVLRDVTTADW